MNPNNSFVNELDRELSTNLNASELSGLLALCHVIKRINFIALKYLLVQNGSGGQIVSLPSKTWISLIYALMSENLLDGLSGGNVDDILRAVTPYFSKLSKRTNKRFQMAKMKLFHEHLAGSLSLKMKMSL